MMSDDLQDKNTSSEPQSSSEMTAKKAGQITEEEMNEKEREMCRNCEKMKKECEEYKQGWQRALADYTNLQKETKARMAEWVQLSEQQILEEFIPVYDNFKKAFSNEQGTINKEQENWVIGIKYIMKQFGDILKAHKVEEIKTVGEKFDPKFHETVGEEKVEGDDLEGIIKEVDGGYIMNGRVIKVAKVIINS